MLHSLVVLWAQQLLHGVVQEAMALGWPPVVSAPHEGRPGLLLFQLAGAAVSLAIGRMLEHL